MWWNSRLTGFGAVLGVALAACAQAQEGGAGEPYLEYAFAEVVTLAAAVSPGPTGYGGRNIIPITGGTFEGEGLKGEVMPGGWDWQLTRADGCTDVVADYFLKTDDGVVIKVHNTGALCPPGSGGPGVVRTHPVFEAPLGKYDWLSKTTFIGTLDGASGPNGEPAVRIKFYRVK